MRKQWKICLFFVALNIITLTKIYATNSEYTTTIGFGAGYQIGDYIEFLKVDPVAAYASGNYEISIAYTRGNVAAAATYIASVAHGGASMWREAGRVNSNGYASLGSDGHNFTVDVNTEYGNSRIRIRAIRDLGVLTEPIGIFIKVRSINENTSWTPVNVTGNDVSVDKFLPMTNDWSLYVGNCLSYNGASLAIKALENGNVGIGTAAPSDKLSVKGRIRAQEVKVEIANWPDYVFLPSYKIPTLQETEHHIKEKGHLPGIPSAKEVEKNGIELGEMNKKLLQKIEELTLHLIEKDKQLIKQSLEIKDQEQRLQKLESLMSKK